MLVDDLARRSSSYGPPPILGSSSRRFAPTFWLTAIALAIAWPLVTYFGLNHYGAEDVAFAEALYARKTIAMDRTQVPRRLVIVAGSSGLFGVDAELMEHELHRPVVNISTHAGLGARYLLDRAEHLLKPGDDVLLSPEYELWVQPAAGYNAMSWDYAITYDKPFVFHEGFLPAIQALYGQSLPEYLQAYDGWRLRYKRRIFNAHGNYDVSAMDPQGDLRRPVPRSLKGSTWELPFPNPEDQQSAVKCFSDFALWAKAQHIRIFYAWPPRATPDGTLPAQSKAPPPVLKMLQSIAEVLDAPEDDVYPAAWFTDTVYHADSGCRRVRTERLIRLLSPRLASAPTPADVPSAIYLVGSGSDLPPAPPRTFAEQPGTRARYLVAGENARPDAVNHAQLLALYNRNLPIWFDDPAILTSLRADGWRSENALHRRATPDEWIARYAQCVFVIVQGDGTPPHLFSDRLPSGPILVVARPPFTHPMRLSRENLSHFSSDLSAITHEKGPDLLVALSAHGRAGRLQIEVNHHPRADAGAGETAVIAIDTQMGIVLDSATFDSEGFAAQATLSRLVHR